jgi:hypothetical protein
MQQSRHHAGVVDHQHIRRLKVGTDVAEDAMFYLIRSAPHDGQARVATLAATRLGWLLRHQRIGEVEIVVLGIFSTLCHASPFLRPPHCGQRLATRVLFIAHPMAPDQSATPMTF